MMPRWRAVTVTRTPAGARGAAVRTAATVTASSHYQWHWHSRAASDRAARGGHPAWARGRYGRRLQVAAGPGRRPRRAGGARRAGGKPARLSLRANRGGPCPGPGAQSRTPDACTSALIIVTVTCHPGVSLRLSESTIYSDEGK